MKKIVLLFYCFIVLLFSFLLATSYRPLIINSFIYADELDDIAKQISELEKARQMSVNATKPLESELGKLEIKLNNIQLGIKKAENNIVLLASSIKKREKAFNIQYTLLAQRVESYYKTLRQPSSLLLLFSSKTASDLSKNLSYRQAAADEDKRIIAKISRELIKLETDKKQLEINKKVLALLKSKIDKQAAFFRKEIKGAKEYQTEISSKIAVLSAKQQQIIAQKLGSLNLPTSLGAGPLYCTDDRNLDPGFSPAFAFFTYGIPHRVGMNQYGAFGRAKAGQSYRDILQAYFNGINFEKKDPNMRIKVQGYGEKGLDEYLLGIYEMPENWDIKALKAQVVAARSYALAYTNNGAGEICTTQACQVYKGGNKGGNWEKAVRETAGEVMVSGGQPIKAWYSSTDGGYTHSSGDVWGSNKPWTKSVQDTGGSIGSFTDLQAKAYDKDSPCFYAAQGWRNEYGKSAWLKSSELADIANVIMLARYSDVDKKHLYQIDKPNPEGVETWNESRVRQELSSRGGSPISSANSASVTGVDWGSGRTTQISINGVSFSGSEFKDWFNLRAPANIQIVGPLFNIEKK